MHKQLGSVPNGVMYADGVEMFWDYVLRWGLYYQPVVRAMGM